MNFDLSEGISVRRVGSYGSMEQLLTMCSSGGLHVSRDVVIASEESKITSELRAQVGDFWFHTDGVFLDVPPRLMIIQVLEADGGGDLEVVDLCDLTIPWELQSFPINYGQGENVLQSSVCSTTARGVIWRYRKDFMASTHGAEATLAQIHEIMGEYANSHAQSLGALNVGDCLILDNWRYLHRRRAFEGKRTIRRVWFEPS